jgi:hypothetical protein
MSRALAYRFAAVLLFGVSTLACGSKQQAPPPSPTAETLQQLGGTWKLSSFVPEKPLEQPFQGLVDAQMKALTVSFRGDQYFAAGPGVNLQGRFQVTTAIGETFQATLFDPDGVPYPIAGRFRGANIDFQSQNERWRGSGVLTRAPAAQ